MAFYIIFSEYCGVAPSMVHFAYIYRVKALAKHVGFWYLTDRGNSAGIARLPSNLGLWKYNFLFYLLEHYMEFKAGCK